MSHLKHNSAKTFLPSESTANLAATKYVDISSTRFAYRRFGKPSSVPLVFLQRYRGTMDHWDPLFLDLIAKERELIVLDNAGVGLSSGQVPKDISGMAKNVADFLDTLGLAQVDILGWSMGGCAGQQLTLDRPDLVRRLVLAGTTPGGVTDAPKTPDKVVQVLLKPEMDDEDFLYLFFPDTKQGREDGLVHLRRLEQRGETPPPTVKPESFQAQVRAIGAFITGATATLPRLGEIKQPVLVANGQCDIMLPPYHSFVMAQRLPNAQLVLYPNSGHGFLFQHTELFAKNTLEFLNSDPARMAT